MFVKSSIVVNCVSSRQRQLAGDLVAVLVEKLAWWLKQELDTPRPLGAEAQLQQLWGISAQAVLDFCAEVEQAVVESAEDVMVQLGQTALDSLAAVGYDCSSFEWVMEA